MNNKIKTGIFVEKYLFFYLLLYFYKFLKNNSYNRWLNKRKDYVMNYYEKIKQERNIMKELLEDLDSSIIYLIYKSGRQCRPNYYGVIMLNYLK